MCCTVLQSSYCLGWHLPLGVHLVTGANQLQCALPMMKMPPLRMIRSAGRAGVTSSDGLGANLASRWSGGGFGRPTHHPSRASELAVLLLLRLLLPRCPTPIRHCATPCLRVVAVWSWVGSFPDSSGAQPIPGTNSSMDGMPGQAPQPAAANARLLRNETPKRRPIQWLARSPPHPLRAVASLRGRQDLSCVALLTPQVNGPRRTARMQVTRHLQLPGRNSTMPTRNERQEDLQ